MIGRIWRGAGRREEVVTPLPPPVTMAGLTRGTRVRHLAWGLTGTVSVLGGITEICWDEAFGALVAMVSPEGPVFPSDLEILEEGP